MPFSISAKNTTDYILLLRAASIVVQSALVLFVNLVLDYQLPWFTIFLIILAEVVFNALTFWLQTPKSVNNPKVIFGQLLADILFLTALLYFSGGATNAFVSLLLIPVAIAAVTLPYQFMLTIALLAVVSYSVLLWLMPMHVMHGNMEGHFIGMWLNFLFTAIVVVAVVSNMARAISKNRMLIAKYREQQLKQEQIVALGVASAQVTHDLATPISSIQLLADELQEVANDDQKLIISDLEKQVQRCSEKIHGFRQKTQEIRSGDKFEQHVGQLLDEVKRSCLLNYPEVNFLFNCDEHARQCVVLIDSSFLPALINLIDNAVAANMRVGQENVDISLETYVDTLSISIKDYGGGFSEQMLDNMGQLISSPKNGLGVAMLLSNASVERIHGEIVMVNHQDKSGGAIVSIKLPLIVK